MRTVRDCRWALLAAVLAASTSAFAADFVAPPLPPAVTYPSAKVVKITDKGAIADEKTLCTDAIKNAIDEVAAAGGGIVEFPKADKAYLTGPIRFKSNITLQVDEGATIKFATDPKLYPLEKTRYEAVDIMNYSPLIYAYQCENIRITGKGTIDGQGQWWWDWARNPTPATAPGAAGSPRGGGSGQGVGGTAEAKRLMALYTADREGKYPLAERIFGDKNTGYRPSLIEVYECKNILIEGVTVKQSPFWTIHPLYSENFTLRNANVSGISDKGVSGPNTDGCDPDSCQTVLIEGVTFNTGDDCIAIKSGRDGDGIRRNKPCENLTIRNCIMNGGHGAITMGSETSAGIHHILAENCTIDGPDVALRLKTSRNRGGGIEDFMARNITVKSVKQNAILVTLRYGNAVPETPKNETTPVAKNIWVENLTCDAAPREGILIQGLNESHIENISLKNVTIKSTKGAVVDLLDGLTRENVTVTPASGEAWTITNSTKIK